MTKEEIRNEYRKTLERLPMEFRSSFSYYAYKNGRPSGKEEEELICLIGLVNEFKPSIDLFEKRIMSESWTKEQREVLVKVFDAIIANTTKAKDKLFIVSKILIMTLGIWFWLSFLFNK